MFSWCRSLRSILARARGAAILPAPPKAASNGRLAARATSRMPQKLTCILHFLAQRANSDEGFMLATSALSVDACRFVSPVRLQEGERLNLKIVSGAHAIDVAARVNGLGPDVRGCCTGQLSFQDMSFDQRAVISNLVRRFRSHIA